MGNKLFVSNIDFSVDTDKLKEIFSEVGTTQKVTIAVDKLSGKSRGYAFIEMNSNDEAKKAIESLNKRMINGRPLSVAEDISDRSPVGASSSSQNNSRQNGTAEYVPVPPMPRLFVRKKKKLDPFLEDENLTIDYKDVRMLSKFISERGRILPRKLTGLSSYNQRKVSKAIKRAQNLGLMSYSTV